MSETWIIVLVVTVVCVALLLIVLLRKREKRESDLIGIALQNRGNDETGQAAEWLKKHMLADDTYINLLFKCFRLDKPIPVSSITVNNETEDITIQFTVPNTNKALSVVMDFDEVEFEVGGPNDKTKQAWIFFDLDLWSESPIYDEDTQIPIDHIDWEYVVLNITSVKLYVSEEQYNTLFPEVTI